MLPEDLSAAPHTHAPAPRRCERCDAELGGSRRSDARFCGSGCRGLASRKRATSGDAPSQQATEGGVPRKCGWCGGSLAALRGDALYCSAARATAARRARKEAEAELKRAERRAEARVRRHARKASTAFWTALPTSRVRPMFGARAQRVEPATPAA